MRWAGRSGGCGWGAGTAGSPALVQLLAGSIAKDTVPSVPSLAPAALGSLLRPSPCPQLWLNAPDPKLPAGASPVQLFKHFAQLPAVVLTKAQPLAARGAVRAQHSEDPKLQTGPQSSRDPPQAARIQPICLGMRQQRAAADARACSTSMHASPVRAQLSLSGSTHRPSDRLSSPADPHCQPEQRLCRPSRRHISLQLGCVALLRLPVHLLLLLLHARCHTLRLPPQPRVRGRASRPLLLCRRRRGGRCNPLLGGRVPDRAH